MVKGKQLRSLRISGSPFTVYQRSTLGAMLIALCFACPRQGSVRDLSENKRGNLLVLPFGLDCNMLTGRNLSVRRVWYGNGWAKNRNWQ